MSATLPYVLYTTVETPKEFSWVVRVARTKGPFPPLYNPGFPAAARRIMLI
jgi:hypothetical protein